MRIQKEIENVERIENRQPVEPLTMEDAVIQHKKAVDKYGEERKEINKELDLDDDIEEKGFTGASKEPKKVSTPELKKMKLSESLFESLNEGYNVDAHYLIKFDTEEEALAARDKLRERNFTCDIYPDSYNWWIEVFGDFNTGSVKAALNESFIEGGNTFTSVKTIILDKVDEGEDPLTYNEPWDEVQYINSLVSKVEEELDLVVEADTGTIQFTAEAGTGDSITIDYSDLNEEEYRILAESSSEEEFKNNYKSFLLDLFENTFNESLNENPDQEIRKIIQILKDDESEDAYLDAIADMDNRFERYFGEDNYYNRYDGKPLKALTYYPLKQTEVLLRKLKRIAKKYNIKLDESLNEGMEEINMGELLELVDRYNTSTPVSGDWDTETQHEQKIIADHFNLSMEEAKQVMIDMLGFEEDMFPVEEESLEEAQNYRQNQRRKRNANLDRQEAEARKRAEREKKLQGEEDWYKVARDIEDQEGDFGGYLDSKGYTSDEKEYITKYLDDIYNDENEKAAHEREYQRNKKIEAEKQAEEERKKAEQEKEEKTKKNLERIGKAANAPKDIGNAFKKGLGNAGIHIG